ncbi:MAG: lipid hydroperoxide peroxidase [Candidatus Fischerbacteria bacterium RBG_13_37_8]|uniref:Thiol peroxidase n=1 Tax=Candidatus Fischerbacteria bacterium RBG_13_37_8 TaxID=1817863 RepID=A0A1F5VNB2_9BACT|nr:MAG: lipid hydroperoxide peroxidase [Candidatus Fischerbacteria bacterium RBG_13_37_8]
MPERKDVITSKGNPLTLLGPELKIGEKAPDFQLINNDLQPVTLKNYGDKIKVISAVPSLDTNVCSIETHKFNELAAKMASNVVIITVSMDLPFAQKRWCGANGIDKVITLSDYKDHMFGTQYGIRIKELGLLARTIFILDKDNIIRYIQQVPETGHEPDYNDVLKALDTLK